MTAAEWRPRDRRVELPADVRTLLAKLEAGRTDDDVTADEWGQQTRELLDLLPSLSQAERDEVSCRWAELLAAEFGGEFECAGFIVVRHEKRARAVEMPE